MFYIVWFGNQCEQFVSNKWPDVRVSQFSVCKLWFGRRKKDFAINLVEKRKKWEAIITQMRKKCIHQEWSP